MATLNTPRSLFTALRFASTIVLATTLGSAGFAQTSSLSDEEFFANLKGFDETEAAWSIESGFIAHGEGDLANRPGDLSLSRGFLRLTFSDIDTKGSGYQIRLAEEDSSYDFDTATPLSLVSPFDDLKNTSLSLKFTGSDEEANWLIETKLNISRETGVSPSQGIYGDLVAERLWKVSDSFKLGFGLYAYTKLENDTEFLPYPLIDWQISDRLRAGLVEASLPGYGLELRLSDKLDAYAIGTYNVRQYRLEDRTEVTGGALVDEEFSARLGFIWKGESLTFDVFGGVSRRDLDLEVNGTTFDQDVVGSQTLVGARLGWTF